MKHSSFPLLLKRKIRGHRVAYLDNAATTQKPTEVIAAMSRYYETYNANIHRGIHTLSQEASSGYEQTREKIRQFLNARDSAEIIFTSGATAALNLVAYAWGQQNLRRGDEILLTEMEHHSNLVPWQVVARARGVKTRYLPLTRNGRLVLKSLHKYFSRRTKLVAVAHVSNVLGTINPVEKICRAAHQKGAIVVVDGAQACGHIKVDVQKLGCDFYALSGHKMYGPTGVGVLYGRKDLLDKMPPYQTGGSMIKKVEVRSSAPKSRAWHGIQIIWNDAPWKFEAGTPPIAEVVGLGAAIDFLNKIGFKAIMNHESKITKYALKQMKEIPGLTIYGPHDEKNRLGVISFNLDDIPAHDIASFLDEYGIAIRTGQHCAQPLHQKLGIGSSARASFALYNDKADIDKLVKALKNAKRYFGEN